MKATSRRSTATLSVFARRHERFLSRVPLGFPCGPDEGTRVRRSRSVLGVRRRDHHRPQRGVACDDAGREPASGYGPGASARRARSVGTGYVSEHSRSGHTPRSATPRRDSPVEHGAGRTSFPTRNTGTSCGPGSGPAFGCPSPGSGNRPGAPSRPRHPAAAGNGSLRLAATAAIVEAPRRGTVCRTGIARGRRNRRADGTARRWKRSHRYTFGRAGRKRHAASAPGHELSSTLHLASRRAPAACNHG